MLSCAAMLSLTGGMLDTIGLKGRTTIVFSEQIQFRQCAHEFYEYAGRRDSVVNKMIAPPQFGDMREVIPLQAAEIIAYEFYKECDRQFNAPSRKPRYGFQVITKMSNRISWSQPACRFIGRAKLLAFVNGSEALNRPQAYWTRSRIKNQTE